MNVSECGKGVGAIEHEEAPISVADLDSVNQQRVELCDDAIYLRSIHAALIAGISLQHRTGQERILVANTLVDHGYA